MISHCRIFMIYYYIYIIGVTQQLGQTIVAMSTLVSQPQASYIILAGCTKYLFQAIAVNTFIVIFFRRGAKAVLVATFIVGLIWVYVTLFVAITVSAHTRGNVHLDTPTP